jgi:demethylmenaquinone methyltransferase/2-methoxy-6-polyprenyl-1,4-benzoquinol methylase
MDHDILHEQMSYYRARAQEYDASTRETAEWKGVFARARDLLHRRGHCEQVLELACGTGYWTRDLVVIGQEITAIDAAPEMLEIAQQKLGNARVHYQQADLFQGEPEQEYDLVFFAYRLSHVPPQACDVFLRKVSRAVRSKGYVVIIDQYAPTPQDRQFIKEGEEGSMYAQRSLSDGKAFTIVSYPTAGSRGLVSGLQRSSEYRRRRSALLSSLDTSGHTDKVPVLAQSCRTRSVRRVTFLDPTKSACRT